MESSITVKLSKEDKELIDKACKLLGVGYSPFIKMLALEKAREIVLKVGQDTALNR